MLFTACLMVMGTALNLHANVVPAPDSKMIVKIEKGDEAKTIKLYVANLLDQRTEVSLQDMDGKIWFSEYVWNEAGFAKKLNLNEMPEGNYLFFVLNKNGKFVQMLSLGENEVDFFRSVPAFAGKKAVAVYASYNTRKRGQLITYITQPGKHTIGVQLANLEEKTANLQINAVGESIAYDETVSGKHGYAKLLNTEGMLPGNYYLYVKTDKTTFVQFFKLTKEGVMFEEAQQYIVKPRGWAAR
jgi:predicted peptidase